MPGESFRDIEDLFHAALERPEAGRDAFLREHVADAAVRARVQVLLAAHAASHVLLDAPSPGALPGGTFLGPYELLQLIGAGGMGSVYLARRADGQYDKRVAIKLTHQGLLDPSGRFERERQILAQLEHPHIARLLDAGLSRHGQPYVVMEWIDGLTLDRWIAQRRPSLEQRLDLWEKVAAAVGHAHRSLIVHRDLKPTNVLVTEDGTPKLIDFGIAKEVPAGGEATQTLQLTPRYASPEQLRGQRVTTATDVYSLGVMLFELVEGRHPFTDPDPQAPRAVKFDAHTPKDLAAVIGMALRVEPERRYATVEQLLEDLRRCRRGLPVAAQPESRSYRLRLFLARHRWGVAAASVAVIALIGVASVAVLQAQRATRQLARASTVSEFISGIMGVLPGEAPSTLRSRGASLKVVELVDSVAARMDRELADQPEAEATIRYLAASAYNQMGLYSKALPQASRAAALFAGQRADDDPERVAAEILLGTVQVYLGQFAEAERLLSATRRAWRSPTPYTTAALESVLGVAQLRLGQRDAAERTLEHCLGVMEAGLGPDDPWIGLVLSNLSIVYQERGEWLRAKQVLERAVQLARARRAEAPEALGWAALNLAIVERILDRPAATKALAAESIAAFETGLGGSSPPAAQAMTQRAWAAARLQEPDAEVWARRALGIQRDKLPEGHGEQAVGLTWLGFVLLQQGELAEARPLLERALEIRRATAPTQDWRTHAAAGFLGEVLLRQGETERGLALLRQAVDALTAQFGAANVRTQEARRRLERWTAPGIRSWAGKP